MFLRLKFIAAASALLILTACIQEEKNPHHIKVGVIGGTEQQIAEVVRKVAKSKYNLDVELVVFGDYILPNDSLNRGEIDVNAFQHSPYLEQQIKDRGYTELVAVGNTFVYPMAVYSKNISSLSALKDGDYVAIPNDPTNLGRALLLLQKAGLIKLKADVGLLPTTMDLIENPKKLQFVELEAVQLPRALVDKKIALAVINTSYASRIDLIPERDGLFVEDKHSPYVNLIVARKDNKNAENVRKFVQAWQSDEVNEAADRLFHHGAVKGW